MRTKPDSHRIEQFIRENLDELTPSGDFVYEEDGIEPVNLGDKEELLRVLKDGIYGVLWGRYSSKSRVKVSDIVKNLRERGLSQAEIDSVLGKSN